MSSGHSRGGDWWTSCANRSGGAQDRTKSSVAGRTERAGGSHASILGCRVLLGAPNWSSTAPTIHAHQRRQHRVAFCLMSHIDPAEDQMGCREWLMSDVGSQKGLAPKGGRYMTVYVLASLHKSWEPFAESDLFVSNVVRAVASCLESC